MNQASGSNTGFAFCGGVITGLSLAWLYQKTKDTGEKLKNLIKKVKEVVSRYFNEWFDTFQDYRQGKGGDYAVPFYCALSSAALIVAPFFGLTGAVAGIAIMISAQSTMVSKRRERLLEAYKNENKQLNLRLSSQVTNDCLEDAIEKALNKKLDEIERKRGSQTTISVSAKQPLVLAIGPQTSETVRGPQLLEAPVEQQALCKKPNSLLTRLFNS